MTMSSSWAKYFGRLATYALNSMGRIGTCADPASRLSILLGIPSSCPGPADEHLSTRLVNLYADLAANVCGRGTDQHAIVARVDDPTALGRVPATERCGVETQRDV